MKLKMFLSVVVLACSACAYSQDAEPAVYNGMGDCAPAAIAPCAPTTTVVEPCAPAEVIAPCAPTETVEACAPVVACTAVADCDCVAVSCHECCLAKLLNQAKARVAAIRVPKVRTACVERRVVERVVVKKQIVRAKVAQPAPCAPVCESCR